MENQTTQSIDEISTQLVELTRLIKEQQARSTLLKQQIADLWTGGPVRCEGGTVTLVDATEFNTLNLETLRQLIFERCMLSQADVDHLIQESRVPTARAAYVLVRLTEGAV